MTDRLLIRSCREADLAALEHNVPSPGLNRFHEARYRNQESGIGTFLVALLDDSPVGSAEILWLGCGAAEVQQRFPGCPELSGLNVQPARQSQGIGTAIIRAAEALAARRGRDRLGLGVDDGNPRAAELYLRLGYRDLACTYVDRYHYLDEQGIHHEAADPCRFLIRDLPPVADPM